MLKLSLLSLFKPKKLPVDKFFLEIVLKNTQISLHCARNFHVFIFETNIRRLKTPVTCYLLEVEMSGPPGKAGCPQPIPHAHGYGFGHSKI